MIIYILAIPLAAALALTFFKIVPWDIALGIGLLLCWGLSYLDNSDYS